MGGVEFEAGDPGWFLERSNTQGRSTYFQLSVELKRLQVVRLSEFRRHRRDEIRVDGYTYFWSGLAPSSRGAYPGPRYCSHGSTPPGRMNGIHCVSERFKSLRLKHSQGVLIVVSVYAPNKLTGKNQTRPKDATQRHLLVLPSARVYCRDNG